MQAPLYAYHGRGFTSLQWLVVTLAGACVALSTFAYYAMLEDVNAKTETTGRTFSKWQRNPVTFYRVLKMHRQLFPESRLRVMCLFGSLGMLVMVVALVHFIS